MSDISSDLAGHASSRMASVRFTLAMRVSAAIFAALAFGLLVAPRLVLALIGDADDPVIEIALAHVGALFGGLAFLTWRMRMIVARRAQIAARFAFSEVRDNLTGAEMLPIDMMRCKLAFFGASRFDPRSDKWVRINLFQGAPYPLDPA